MKKVNRVFITALTLLLMNSPGHAAKMLQVKGSDTLINLVQRMAEDYMAQNPGKYVAVTGGGSGTGIAALLNNKCDIADSSREMKTSEYEQAQTRAISPVPVVIAIDGLSMIVHPENLVTQLTVDEIGKIFRGEVNNWSQVGGRDMPIKLYGRQSNSGTYEFMKELILKGDFSIKMNRMNGNAQIVEAVKTDETGIGFVGVGYIQDNPGVNVLKVAAKTGGKYADSLNEEDVNSGVYPIARPLYQYVNGAPKDEIKEFIAFELSPTGQAIVKEEGFYPIPQSYVELNQRRAGL